MLSNTLSVCCASNVEQPTWASFAIRELLPSDNPSRVRDMTRSRDQVAFFTCLSHGTAFMPLRLAADTRHVSASYLLTRQTIEFFSNT